MTEIELLYKIQKLCEENDFIIEINDKYLIFRHYGEIKGRPYNFNQAFHIYDIENLFNCLDTCADVFTRKLEEEKKALKGDE